MPIFEYTCEECGCEFEMLVFREDEAACPSCGAKSPKKRMSSFGFSVGYKFTSSSSAGKGSCAGCSSSDCSSCS